MNMPKNFTFHIIILFYPGLVELGSLSYPGIFSILAVVAVNTMSVFIINRKQYYIYYDLSKVSNFKYGRYYNCLWRALARLMAKL